MQFYIPASADEGFRAAWGTDVQRVELARGVTGVRGGVPGTWHAYAGFTDSERETIKDLVRSSGGNFRDSQDIRPSPSALGFVADIIPLGELPA
jgi:hypothetical protein